MAEIAPPPPNIVAPAVEQPQPAVQPTAAETNPPATAETQTPPAGQERQASREVPRDRQVQEMGRVARASLNRRAREVRAHPTENPGDRAVGILDEIAGLQQEQLPKEGYQLKGSPLEVTSADGAHRGTFQSVDRVDGETLICTLKTDTGAVSEVRVARQSLFMAQLGAEITAIAAVLPPEQARVLELYVRAQAAGAENLGTTDAEINQTIEAAAQSAGFPTRAALERFLQKAIPDGEPPQGENGAPPDPALVAKHEATVQANAAQREAAIALCDGQNVPDAATVVKVLVEAGYKPDELKQRLAEAQQHLRTYSEVARMKPGELHNGIPLTAEMIEEAKSRADYAQAEVSAYGEASKGTGPIEQYMGMLDDGTITREQATAVMGAIESGDVNAMVNCLQPDLQDDINDDAQKIGDKRKRRELIAGRLRKMGGLAGAAAAIMALAAFFGSKQNKG